MEVLTVDTEDWKWNLGQQSRVDIQGIGKKNRNIYVMKRVSKATVFYIKKSENKFYYKCLLNSFLAANVCPVKDTIHMGYLPSIMSRYQVLFFAFLSGPRRCRGP